MSTRDDDIEFDFFEEPATQEASAARERTLRRPLGNRSGNGRPPRPPLRTPTGGITPLLRLIGLVAFAILIVVLLVFWAQSCRSDQKRDAYADYMTEVEGVATDSATVGRDLSELLTTPGLRRAELGTRLNGLLQQQQQVVDAANALDPPGPLRVSHEEMVQALEFRVAGLRGLQETFAATGDDAANDATAAGQRLAAQAERLVAGDVLWEDAFRAEAVRVLQEEEIAGVEVPASEFVQTPDLASTRTMVPIWQRVNGASTGGTPSGLHGTQLGTVVANPGNRQLVAGQESTIQASTELNFVVSVTNSGNFQEVGVQVTLTIPKQPNSIVKKQTIDIIDPGQTKTATFRDFPSLPFGERVQMRVDIEPVPGERNTTNNTAEFPVLFSL